MTMNKREEKVLPGILGFIAVILMSGLLNHLVDGL